MTRNRKDRPRKPQKKRPEGHFYERFDKRKLAAPSSVDPVRNKRRVEGVEKLLSGIGVPESRPFKPDAFQLEALAAIDTEDVLVTAPTGSGKTWIAREEIRRLLAAGKKAWYTTPLKALTNSKYAEFSEEFGAENVGILTGDRKENFDAPLIVGTTEIYRNQLFDALRTGSEVETDLVILDEAHYLADEDRGHVWEEAIILSPKRIRLLLLSATVGGAEEFADWIEQVRETKVRVVKAGPRPVELRAAYLSSELDLYPLFGPDGGYNRDIDAAERKKTDAARRRFPRRRR
ncbi:MAG: DEAD/DEAH box helicase [Pyrinomonadaceae bacterium]|nr:DEAD/DEAH box helicase [Pyrinomonadaceae bacterium]